MDRALGVPDAALAARVITGDTKAALDASYGGKVAKGALAFNVVDYGAVADATDSGGTDNTVAFQAAMDAAWGAGKGGTLVVPPGSYHLSSYVVARSNVRVIGYGATLRKYGSSISYSAFQTLSNGAQGYGSSAVNILFEGLTFRGKFGTGGSGIAATLHHAQGVTFRKCTWVESVVGGHCIDLMGCDGVLVDDCTFQGFNPSLTDNREYVEAIQLDYSMVSSGGNDTLPSFDGLPTINVTVQNSRFIPLVVGGTTYPAPNPLGSHSRVHDRWFDNIKFVDNFVEGCHEPVTTDTFALLNVGWLHFLCTRNVQIRGNTFRNTNNRSSKVLTFRNISTGTALADVGVVGAASTTMTVLPIQNLLIEGNTFEGFTSDTFTALIDVRGTESQNARNIRVMANTVRDSYSTPGVTGDKGSDFIYTQDATGITMNDNYLNTVRSLLYFFRVTKISIRGGQLINLGAYITRFSTCNQIVISDVRVDGHGGGHYIYNGCTGLDINGGEILNGRADAIRKKHVSISSGTEFIIRNMRIPADGNGYTSAIDCYTTSTKGKVKDIFATGWTSGNLVSLGPGSVVTATENVF